MDLIKRGKLEKSMDWTKRVRNDGKFCRRRGEKKGIKNVAYTDRADRRGRTWDGGVMFMEYKKVEKRGHRSRWYPDRI